MSSPRLGDTYDRRALIPFDGSTYTSSVLADLDAIGKLSSDAYVVDIGCGRGWHISELARRGYRRLWAIDASATSLRRAMVNVGSDVGRSVHLVWGDAARWGVAAFFDVALCFFASFGTVSCAADRSFLEAVRRMLKTRGRFVATAFDGAAAHELTGRFSVSYDADSDEEVVTEVTFDARTQSLRIEQSHSVLGAPLVETLRLYTVDEMRRLLTDVGFEDVACTSEPSSKGVILINATVQAQS